MKLGYGPVDHQLRDGSNTVSFYRGPFRAYKEKESGMTPQMNGDAWLRYDPAIGMFDITYSAAYCLGRQLALQNGSYAADLHKWRSEDKAQAGKIRQRYILACRLGLEPEISSCCMELMTKSQKDAVPDGGSNLSGIEGTGLFSELMEKAIKERLERAAKELLKLT